MMAIGSYSFAWQTTRSRGPPRMDVITNTIDLLHRVMMAKEEPFISEIIKRLKKEKNSSLWQGLIELLEKSRRSLCRTSTKVLKKPNYFLLFYQCYL